MRIMLVVDVVAGGVQPTIHVEPTRHLHMAEIPGGMTPAEAGHFFTAVLDEVRRMAERLQRTYEERL